MLRGVFGGGTATIGGARPDDARRRVADLRCCLSRFATGVAVVTFADPETGAPRGLTVNSFTSVSLDPPLVLIGIARSARAHDALIGRPFCVNVLGAEQEALARRFAGGAARAHVRWSEEGTAPPRLHDALAQLACAPHRAHDGGDHTLILGAVTDFVHREGDALGYLASRFTTVAEPRLGVEHLI